jgi:hypothetical protein
MILARIPGILHHIAYPPSPESGFGRGHDHKLRGRHVSRLPSYAQKEGFDDMVGRGFNWLIGSTSRGDSFELIAAIWLNFAASFNDALAPIVKLKVMLAISDPSFKYLKRIV